MTISRLLALLALLPFAAQAAELTTRPLSELAVYPVYRVNATGCTSESGALRSAGRGGGLITYPC